MPNPLDPAQQKRWKITDRYIQTMNQWEEALRTKDYAAAMAFFEQGMTLLPTFIEDAKVWSKTHSFEATEIRGLKEAAYLYAMTNNRGKLSWLKGTLENFPDLVKFVPVVDEALLRRDAAEKILELCAHEDGFLQKDLKKEVESSATGHIVNYFEKFGLIRKVQEGSTNRLFREHFRPNWCFWPLPRN